MSNVTAAHIIFKFQFTFSNNISSTPLHLLVMLSLKTNASGNGRRGRHACLEGGGHDKFKLIQKM